MPNFTQTKLCSQMNFFETSSPEIYNEDSFLTAESIVTWKREKGSYNFDSLPATAILVANTKILKRFSKPFNKKIKGLPGSGYILSKDLLLCSMQGSGAPGMILLLEELRVLGITHFIFIGMAGILDKDITSTPCLINCAHSGVGSSYFYAPGSKLFPKQDEWFQKIRDQLNLKVCASWSTDCPYRETPTLLALLKKQKVQLIDMESAAVYSFASYYGLQAACILIGADDLTLEAWQPPAATAQLFKVQKQLINQLINFHS